MSSPMPCPTFFDSGNLEVEPKPIVLERPPSSVTVQMENMTKCARQLQISCPKWTDVEVVLRIRELIESGAFGHEMCTLLHSPPPSTRPSVVQPANFLVPVPQPSGNGYHVYSQSASYSQHGMQPLYDSTINPTTLQHPYTYMGHLAGEDGDSDITHPEAEFGAHYNYVSVLGAVPDLTLQDTHDASVEGLHPLTYGFDIRTY